MAGLDPKQLGKSAESRELLLEQFAERLKQRGSKEPQVSAVVFAARAEAFLADLTPSPVSEASSDDV